MIEWSETDLLVRDSIRDFIAKEIRPHLDELESGALPPYDIIRKLYAAFGLDVMAAEAVSKLLSSSPKSSSPGSLGGQETLALIAISELAGVSLGIVASLGVSLGLAAATILAKGSREQKERWLPGLATFEKIGAWAITEPDSGSDAFGGMQTTVRRDGDEYVLNGRKTFITNGPFADTVVVYAKLDDGSPVRDRPVLTFVLDRGMPGFVQGKPFKKMGMMSSPTGELFFDDVRLGTDRLLSSSGAESARESFVAERVGVAALSLGIINECLRLCVDYAKSRKLWGQEIGRFQLIQLKLAKMEVARVNVQNMVFQAVAKARAGKRPSLAEASAMKLYSSEAATEVAMEAVQLFGGNGYMAEYRVEQLARDAKSLMIYAGSNEIQVTHIAKALLA
ncbi:alkylation response protein AidB-like acyl-CoA dehydrogenase [Amycolatopsis lexingtonensis]|uniref:Alkylation response protein AidB-like acyl-CoA dehydrogenase n=1 Tax=Amycolatopsis lexingtonensis TaxID=218822 RepID=A0ABR9I589_9PSEU|nr:acyl-CoA dehydrogenase family protein [Amycolatopsis lexingtonensis]MBE1498340.1 alkylation response protein AidB-like acyl-CoA dehydrogenase [Amycolatopsis lexingtonensis]